MKRILPVPFVLMVCLLWSCKKDQTGTIDKNELSAVATATNDLLLSIDIRGNDFAKFKFVDFVVTDPAGNILNVLKNKQGNSRIDIYSRTPYTKTSLGVYRIIQYSDNAIIISGYLGVNKGALWNMFPDPRYRSSLKSIKPLRFRNLQQSRHVICSTNVPPGTELRSARDTLVVHNELAYTGNSRLLIQAQKGDKGYYGFLNIPANGVIPTLDISRVIRPAVEKTIAMPSNTTANVAQFTGFPNKDYDDSYYFGNFGNARGNIRFFYPNAALDHFHGYIFYMPNTRTENIAGYSTTFNGALPARIQVPNMKINVQKDRMYDFQVSFTGQVNNYVASFTNTEAIFTKPGTPFCTVNIAAPAGIQQFKVPDLPKYLKLSGLSFRDMVYAGSQTKQHNLKNVSILDLFSGNFRGNYLINDTYFASKQLVQGNPNQIITLIGGQQIKGGFTQP